MAVNKKALEKVLDTMSSRIDEEFREKFSENFPKLAEKLEKTSEDNLDTIRFYIGYERSKLNEGSIKYYKNLQYNRDRKHNMVVSGILDGTFYEALEIACDDYTDMAWKFFKRVYIYLTTGKELPVYEEFTEKEITEWYNESEWAKEKYSSLEECLSDYVGKPHMSLEKFKSVHDIIDWYCNLRDLYKKMCKSDLNQMLSTIASAKNTN